jgi:hypothetical protein
MKVAKLKDYRRLKITSHSANKKCRLSFCNNKLLRHADHVAPSIRKSWQSLRRQAAVARSF